MVSMTFLRNPEVTLGSEKMFLAKSADTAAGAQIAGKLTCDPTPLHSHVNSLPFLSPELHRVGSVTSDADLCQRNTFKF